MAVAELAPPSVAAAPDDGALAAIVGREARRLRAFIRRRVADACDVEDIAQEVFFELVEATRLATPIEHVGAWLFRVATFGGHAIGFWQALGVSCWHAFWSAACGAAVAGTGAIACRRAGMT